MSRTERSAARAAEPGRLHRRRRDDELLAAAIKVFHERGYAPATVRDIANELGILKGSVYHYIDSKEDLLFRVFEGVHQDVEAILGEIHAAEGLDPLERVRLYVTRLLVHNLRDIARVSIYYHELERLGPERRAAVTGWRRRHDGFMRELIRAAQDAGYVDPSLDATLLANCVFAAVIWPYRWFKPGGGDDVDEVAGACADFVLRGLVGASLPGRASVSPTY